MPYKLEDLRGPGMEQNFRTIEGRVSQPATKETPVSPETSKKPSKRPLVQSSPKSKQIKESCSSPMVEKAKEIMIVAMMALAGIAAVAVVIRGIQFLFSI